MHIYKQKYLFNIIIKNVNEKFINLLMKNGLKIKAYILLRNALRYVYIKNNVILKKKNNVYKKILLNKNAYKYKKFVQNKIIDKKFYNKKMYSIFLYAKNIYFIKNTKHINKKIFLNIHKNFYTLFFGLYLYTLKNYYINILFLKKYKSEKYAYYLKKNICKMKKYRKKKMLLNTYFSKKNFSALNYTNLVLKKTFYLYTAKKRLYFSTNLLYLALNNVKPLISTKNVKIHGKKYIVPKILSKKKQNNYSIKWIIDAAIKRKKKNSMHFYECLGLELLDALNKHGKVFEKRNDVHKLAESNRAYMRFKWW